MARERCRTPPPVDGDSYAVLVVGGTPGETFGIPTRPWPDPGQQVHFLSTLGSVYSQLASTLGADRVIVVAGLRYVLRWLDEAAELGRPPCEQQHVDVCARRSGADSPEGLAKRRAEYLGRAERVRRDCAALLAAGGADYDGERVNPTTVMNVLAGVQERPGDRVVPTDGVRSVFVWVTTHGGHHPVSVGTEARGEDEPEEQMWPGEIRPTTKPKPIDHTRFVCDVCGEPHALEDGEKHEDRYDHDHSSLATREWFLQMPRRATTARDYDIVTTAGRNMDPDSHPGRNSPLACLYAQQIFRSLAVGQQRAPGRALVTLYQFCTSGGHAKWLTSSSYNRAFGVDYWPVFLMATSGELQYSLGATFTKIFLDGVSRALHGEQSGALEDVWREAEDEYWRQHKVEAEMNRRQLSPGRRFGEPVMVKGRYSDVGRIPVSRIFRNRAAAAVAAEQYPRAMSQRPAL